MKRSNQEVYESTKEGSGGDKDTRSLRRRFLAPSSSSPPTTPMLQTVKHEKAQIMAYKRSLLEWNNAVGRDLEVSIRQHVDYMLQRNATSATGGSAYDLRCQQQSIMLLDLMNLAQSTNRDFSGELRMSLEHDLAKLSDPNGLHQKVVRDQRRRQKQRDGKSQTPQQQPEQLANTIASNKKSVNSDKTITDNICSSTTTAITRDDSRPTDSAPMNSGKTGNNSSQQQGHDEIDRRPKRITPSCETENTTTKLANGKEKKSGKARCVLPFFARIIPGWNS